MKILVCVKQVPDPESSLSIDEGARFIRTDSIAFKINRYDEYAVEEALRMKQAFPGTSVDALTVGPARAAGAVRRAIEMGADNGAHILLEGELFHEARLTASLARAYAAGAGYDLILCGVMAEDDMSSQFGPMLASLLDYPFASSIMRASPSPEAGSIRVEREVEGGILLVEVALPAVIAVVKRINRCRLPTILGILEAGRKEIAEVGCSDCECAGLDAGAMGLGGSPTRVAGIFQSHRKRQVEMIGGDAKEAARTLVARLRQMDVL